MSDMWTSGDDYEAYVGRWSRQVAPRFVEGLGVPDGAGWLDVGCGTGALTQTIVDRAAPSQVVGVDPSDAFVAHARAHVVDPRVRFHVGDAANLPVDDATFDAVVGGLMLNFTPDPVAALQEMRRAARAGAVVSVYVWDHAQGGMQLMRHFWDAVVELDPSAEELHERARFPLNRPDRLAETFAAAGLDDVRTGEVVVPTVFADFDDFWRPFLGGVGPAPTYAGSRTPEQLAELRALVRSQLPVEPDGTIPLTARAWTARGVVPA